jgi:sugar lactone lactonase YvrE
MEQVATGYGLIEGPVWDPAKGLYFSDVPNGGVRLLDRAGKVSLVVPKRRGIGGMALHANGGSNTEKTSGFRSKLYSWVSRASRCTFSHTSETRARLARFAFDRRRPRYRLRVACRRRDTHPAAAR